MTKPEFPKTLFIAHGDEFDDQTFVVDTMPEEFGQSGHVIAVAKYQLVEVGVVEAEPVYTPKQ